MDNNDSRLEEIIYMLIELRKSIEENISRLQRIEGWIPEVEARKLLGLKNTSLWMLRKQNLVKYSKIGSWTFYSVDSIKALLERNKR